MTQPIPTFLMFTLMRVLEAESVPYTLSACQFTLDIPTYVNLIDTGKLPEVYRKFIP